MTKINKVYRSDKDKVIAGVCGGLAEYWGIDSLWVRSLFLVTALASSGFGAILYAAAVFLIPSESERPKEKE